MGIYRNKPTFLDIVDLIGELGREVFNLLDGTEESGPVGASALTVDAQSFAKVSAVLDRIDALPFEEPDCILGTGAMLKAALTQTVGEQTNNGADIRYGMSLRAYVAAQVLPTIIAECREALRSRGETYPQFCAHRAMEFADALIAELGKETR